MPPRGRSGASAPGARAGLPSQRSGVPLPGAGRRQRVRARSRYGDVAGRQRGRRRLAAHPQLFLRQGALRSPSLARADHVLLLIDVVPRAARPRPKRPRRRRGRQGSSGGQVRIGSHPSTWSDPRSALPDTSPSTLKQRRGLDDSRRVAPPGGTSRERSSRAYSAYSRSGVMATPASRGGTSRRYRRRRPNRRGTDQEHWQPDSRPRGRSPRSRDPRS